MRPGRAGDGRIKVQVTHFVVLNEQGPGWILGTPMRGQAQWTEHAQFVNRLVKDRFILLAGPLPARPSHTALLIVQGNTESEVRTTLADDPWLRSGILVIRSIEPWEILASHDLFDPVLSELARR